MGLQRAGGGDCLPKTQGYANSQEDVYGLTPARCRKVKVICQPCAKRRTEAPVNGGRNYNGPKVRIRYLDPIQILASLSKIELYAGISSFC